MSNDFYQKINSAKLFLLFGNAGGRLFFHAASAGRLPPVQCNPDQYGGERFSGSPGFLYTDVFIPFVPAFFRYRGVCTAEREALRNLIIERVKSDVVMHVSGGDSCFQYKVMFIAGCIILPLMEHAAFRGCCGNGHFPQFLPAAGGIAFFIFLLNLWV